MADRGRVRSSLESKSSHSGDKDGQGNKFANDGSFMEMFRRKMEAENAKKSNLSSTETHQSGSSSPPAASSSTTHNPDPNRGCSPPPAEEATVNKPTKPLTLPFVGKRRGATPILKTGAVKKTRREDEEEPKKDAWSQYLAEVKKYKEQSCQEENKTRPLVK